MTPIIGIIGGIGSGKSLVAAELVKNGGYLIQGDQLGHEALRQPDIKAKVVERWGQDLLDDKGEIKRRALGLIVFADLNELRVLEGLVFPWIGKRIVEEIARARTDPNVKRIILDAAVMMEAGWGGVCDQVIFVDTPPEVRYQRLREKRGWTEKEVRERERSQMPLEEKRRLASAVIDNSRAPQRVVEQVANLLREWDM